MFTFYTDIAISYSLYNKQLLPVNSSKLAFRFVPPNCIEHIFIILTVY